MKNNGIKAVIIRVGYGRESSQKDSMFESHYKNAKSENMMILECINNKSLDMPIYYDLKDNSQVKLGKAKLTEIAELFCETIKKAVTILMITKTVMQVTAVKLMQLKYITQLLKMLQTVSASILLQNTVYQKLTKSILIGSTIFKHQTDKTATQVHMTVT